MKTIRISIITAFLFLPLLGMEVPQTDTEIEALKVQYNLTPDCRRGLNKETITPPYDPNAEIACLLVGYRDHVYTTKESLATIDPALKKLFKESNISVLEPDYNSFFGGKGNNVYAYRPHGERNALLQAKSSLEDHLRGIQTNDFSTNWYLSGKLFGYSNNDIEFFYQLMDFYERYSTFLGIAEVALNEKLDRSAYVNWPEEDKSVFKVYETRVWPRISRRYYKDRKKALWWLEENKNFSNEQLKEQINELSKEINALPEREAFVESEEDVYPEGS